MTIEYITSAVGAFVKFRQQGSGTVLVNIANIVAVLDLDTYTQIEMRTSKYISSSLFNEFIDAITRAQPKTTDPAANIERIVFGAGTFIKFLVRGAAQRPVLVNVANIIGVEDMEIYTSIATCESTSYLFDGPFDEVVAAITG